MAPDAVGEAISLAANQLDPPRRRPPCPRSAGQQAARQRPRRLDRRPRLRLGQRLAEHGAGGQPAEHGRLPDPRRLSGRRDRVERGGDFLTGRPARWPAILEPIKRQTSPAPCSRARRGDPRQRPEPGPAPSSTAWLRSTRIRRAVFDLLLGYAVSEDGALHAEKYYRTVSEEFAADPPGVPLAAARGAGPGHRQRVRPPGGGPRRSARSGSESLKLPLKHERPAAPSPIGSFVKCCDIVRSLDGSHRHNPMLDREPPALGRLEVEVAQAQGAGQGDVLGLADVEAFGFQRVERLLARRGDRRQVLS